jgi:drug/metabolite transporter (DMT)-like permease
VSQGSRVWTALVVVYILWGSTYLGIAVAGETIPPLFAASTRFIAAGAIMAVVVRLRGGSLRVRRSELLSCVLVGALLPGANAVLFFAERSVATGLASLIIASVPLWIVVFRLVGHERLGTPALAGVALGFAGVAILAHPSAHAKLWGLGLCLLSAVMWAAGSFVSARAPMPTDPFAATAYEMLAGGFLMLLPSIFTVHHFSPSSGSIEGWIYLVIFGSVVGYTAYVWLLAKAPIGLVATYAYVNPIVAITLGVAFRGEHLSWRLLLGAIVVIAAVALVVRQEPASVPAEEGVEPTGATILQRD